jgi:hypothetical protein
MVRKSKRELYGPVLRDSPMNCPTEQQERRKAHHPSGPFRCKGVNQ